MPSDAVLTDNPSVVFLTMPTSGSGSLWRLIVCIAGNAFKPVKISEVMEIAGKGSQVGSWQPEPAGHVFMYNTPHYVNPHFSRPEQRLIVNFRDPRDLVCNQYHWVFQHPSDKSAEELADIRARVAAEGIDHFVSSRNVNNLFDSLRAIEPRLAADDPNVLKLSYAQLCLDFDRLVERLIAFLGVPPASVPWNLVERERTTNLKNNPHWIGQMWTGTDVSPGRHRTELKPETIAKLDDLYRDNLKLVRSIEAPALRHLLATSQERTEMDRVLVGRDDELFLKNDANDTVGQITGTKQLPRVDMIKIAMAHHTRTYFGKQIGNFNYAHVLIPSKEVAHRAWLPKEIVFQGNGPRPILAYLDASLDKLWKPFYQPELLEPDGKERYYPKTDAHWNHPGAYKYFSAALQSIDPQRAATLAAIPLRRFPAMQLGDMAIKLEMPKEPIEIITPHRIHAKLVFDNAINNEGRVVWYKNEAVTDQSRVLVLHDSFTMWLRDFIPELFSEAFFVHGTLFDFEFVEAFAPQTILCFQAERFFPRVPDTGGNLLRYVAAEEQEKKAPRRFSDFIAQDKRFERLRGLK
jgi:hypothetical protein